MKTLTTLLFLALAAGTAAAQQDTRVFDISTLTAPRPGVRAPLLGPETSLDQYFSAEEEQGPWSFLEADQLVEMIRSQVDPENWDRGGEILAAGDGLLVVRSWPNVLGRIETLLSELGAEASRRTRVTFEVYEVDPEKYAEVAAVSDAAALDFAALGGRRLESASAEAWPGVRSALKVTDRVRYVADYDPEIAQGAMIADPIVRFAEEGLAVEFTAHPLLDGDRVLVETVLQSGHLVRPIREVKLAIDEEYLPEPFRLPDRSVIGTLSLPEFRHAEAFASRLLGSGGKFAVPCLAGNRCVVFVIGATVLDGAATSRLLDTGPLCRLPIAREFGYPREVETSEKVLLAPRPRLAETLLPPLEGELLAEMVYTATGAGSVLVLPGGTMIVSGSDEARDRAKEYLRAREKEVFRPVAVDLRIVSSPAGVAEDDAGRPLLAGKVVTLSGRKACLMAGDTLNYLADHDVEVAQESRIADPVIAQSFAGLVANVTPRLAAAGGAAQVAVELLVARRAPMGVFATGSQCLGTVDVVEEKRTILVTTVGATLGEPCRLDAGPDPSDPARRLTLVITVTAD
jgi:hypothetical protein